MNPNPEVFSQRGHNGKAICVLARSDLLPGRRYRRCQQRAPISASWPNTHPLPPTAVPLIAPRTQTPEPRLYSSNLAATTATAEDPQFSRLRPVAVSTAATNAKCGPKFADSPAAAATLDISALGARLSVPKPAPPCPLRYPRNDGCRQRARCIVDRNGCVRWTSESMLAVHVED